jgi:RHS repeat-associated protein
MLTAGTTSYLYGPGGLPVESVTSSGTPTYFMQDQLGSTRLLTSSTGAVTGTYTYDPWGNITSHTGTATTPLLYAGQYQDPATGFYYLRNRWYDPATAQFLTVDPDVNQTQAPYTYVSDNPLNATDPEGLDPIWGPDCSGMLLKYGACPSESTAAGSTPEQVRQSVIGAGVVILGSMCPLFGDMLGILGGGAEAAEDGVDIEAANFAQTTASNSFSAGGSFAGQTIGDVANELESGVLSPDDVPIQVIVRDGNTLILNTRSALALEEAGIPRSEWVLDNVTGDPGAEARLSGQLARNGLGSGGTPTVRIIGGG